MMYPFRFHPVIRQYIWGGRRLGNVLGKKIGDANDYAESWEIVDRRDDQSVISNGAFAGRELRSVLADHRKEILGKHADAPAFPLLFKFLDCNRNLSVQVHPDDARAALLDPPDLGKTEAWVVIDKEPGSKIYAGLQSGVDYKTLSSAVRQGTTESCLHSFEPDVGDCVFIPAGTVHALGAGLVIAEIQQCSDTTYRLFDWNRLDANGNSRPLHIEQGLEAINYSAGPVSASVPTQTDEAPRQRLVNCDKFILDRVTLAAGEELEIKNDDRVHLLAVISGSVALGGDPDDLPLSFGQTTMLPAALRTTALRGQADATILDISLP